MKRRQRESYKLTVSSTAARPGVVLLVVIAAIVVAGLALTRLATASTEQIRAAAVASDDLQRRWGERSCQRLLLTHAADVFVQRQEAARQGLRLDGPIGSIRAQVLLGSEGFGAQSFDLILADEDAKLKLNTLYHIGDMRAVETAVSELAGPGSRGWLGVTPRVESDARVERQTASRADREEEGDGESDLEDISPPSAFRSWGDVIDLGRLRRTTGDARTLAQVTSRLSLWGTEKLNVRRADDQTIEATCAGGVTVGLAKRIIERLRENPQADVKLVLQNVVKNQEDRTELEHLLGQVSTTFSLWVEATSRHSRAQSFIVRTSDPETGVRTEGFRL